MSSKVTDHNVLLGILAEGLTFPGSSERNFWLDDGSRLLQTLGEIGGGLIPRPGIYVPRLGRRAWLQHCFGQAVSIDTFLAGAGSPNAAKSAAIEYSNTF